MATHRSSARVRLLCPFSYHSHTTMPIQPNASSQVRAAHGWEHTIPAHPRASARARAGAGGGETTETKVCLCVQAHRWRMLLADTSLTPLVTHSLTTLQPQHRGQSTVIIFATSASLVGLACAQFRFTIVVPLQASTRVITSSLLQSLV